MNDSAMFLRLCLASMRGKKSSNVTRAQYASPFMSSADNFFAQQHVMSFSSMNHVAFKVAAPSWFLSFSPDVQELRSRTLSNILDWYDLSPDSLSSRCVNAA